MTKQLLQPPPRSTNDQRTAASSAKTITNRKKAATATLPAAGLKVRRIHKEGEVNISAYFPAEVKASLRMVQAKTGNNVKDCLGEALRDLFRKHNVPHYVEHDEGR